LGVEPAQIDRRLPFANFGIDSLTAYTLTGDLADWIGRDLPSRLFWEYPNIVVLSHYLAKALDGQDLNLLHEEMKRVVEEIRELSEDAAQQRLVSVNEQGKKED